MMPTSGKARRVAKVNRNRRAVSRLTCKIQGHVMSKSHPTLCARCLEVVPS